MIKTADFTQALAERTFVLPPYPAVYLETRITNMIADFRDDTLPQHLDGGQAIYAEYGPGYATVHSHPVDQWQIYYDGDGLVSKKKVKPFTIQYTDAWVPYGPIDVTKFFSLVALWPRPCSEVYEMPKDIERVRAALHGQPHRHVLAEIDLEAAPAKTVSEHSIIEDGPVWARRWRLPPGASFTTPDPSAGGGQFFLPIRGVFTFGDREYPTRSAIFVGPRDGSITLVAGPEGAEVVGVQHRPSEH